MRGDRTASPFAVLGRTPDLLVSLGLAPARLVMTRGKVARCRREHPEVTLDTWRKLPDLLAEPLAAFSSEHSDGSLVVVLIVKDTAGDPVVVPVLPDTVARQNVVLSVYGKRAGLAWVRTQIALQATTGQPVFVSNGFAATLPKPGFTEAIPSSPGPIPADGTAKPRRHILRFPPTINEADDA